MFTRNSMFCGVFLSGGSANGVFDENAGRTPSNFFNVLHMYGRDGS
jgi:hypothetical protein